MVGFHRTRQELREKLPSLHVDEAGLTATDKALICYYGFVMLCDSVSAKSEEMFGKKISSREVQIMFARKAVVELKKDGLLK